jgi:hypothetical protein
VKQRESVFNLRDSKHKTTDMGQGNKGRWKAGLQGKRKEEKGNLNLEMRYQGKDEKCNNQSRQAG